MRPLANASIPVGAPVSFTCVPDSVPPPNITWLFNSVVIPGAQQPTYTITMVTGADAGTYTCVASNSVGIAFTSATLTTLCECWSTYWERRRRVGMGTRGVGEGGRGGEDRGTGGGLGARMAISTFSRGNTNGSTP